MKYSTRISGLDGSSLGQLLKEELITGEVAALGIISAFVSIGGFRDILAITQKHKALECRLLAGISNAITHPKALNEALDAGWKLRLGSAPSKRIFHPKMILTGRSFCLDGRVKEPAFFYVGSSNLTKGGLYKNIECGVIGHEDFSTPSVVSSFASLWSIGERATTPRLRLYAEEFAIRNRQRSTEVIEALGVSDVAEEENPTYRDLTRKRADTTNQAIPESVAAAAWAGLDSFTGEYRFQVEFPQAAGLVLNRIIRSTPQQNVRILCTADNIVRDMSYRYYADNGMFRLNIPNDTPGVQQARETHSGIALVEASKQRGVAAQLTILPPGITLETIVRRSFLLGTWGNTSTRSYGWY